MKYPYLPVFQQSFKDQFHQISILLYFARTSNSEDYTGPCSLDESSVSLKATILLVHLSILQSLLEFCLFVLSKTCL